MNGNERLEFEPRCIARVHNIMYFCGHGGDAFGRRDSSTYESSQSLCATTVMRIGRAKTALNYELLIFQLLIFQF